MSPFATSEALRTLKGRFSRHSTIQMNEEGVAFIVGEIERIRQMTLKLERALFRAGEPVRLDRTVRETEPQAGSNLVFFPRVHRRPPTDGSPKGAA